MPADKRIRSVSDTSTDIDDVDCNRWSRLIALTRRVLLSLGNGDPETGRLGLHPAIVIEALDTHQHLPTHLIPVPRATTVAALKEARSLRNKPWEQKSPSERVVSLATSDLINGHDAAHIYIQNVLSVPLATLAPPPFDE